MNEAVKKLKAYFQATGNLPINKSGVGETKQRRRFVFSPRSLLSKATSQRIFTGETHERIAHLRKVMVFVFMLLGVEKLDCFACGVVAEF